MYFQGLLCKFEFNIFNFINRNKYFKQSHYFPLLLIYQCILLLVISNLTFRFFEVGPEHSVSEVKYLFSVCLYLNLPHKENYFIIPCWYCICSRFSLIQSVSSIYSTTTTIRLDCARTQVAFVHLNVYVWAMYMYCTWI